MTVTTDPRPVPFTREDYAHRMEIANMALIAGLFLQRYARNTP